jgi:MFS family permease
MIRSSRILTFVIGTATVSMLIIWMYDKLIILWAKSLGMGVEAFGLIPGMIAAGSILGTFLVAPLHRRFRNPLVLMSTSIFPVGILMIVIGMGGLKWFALPFPLWLAVWFAGGIVAPLFHVPYATLLQSESPREMVGRVVAAANALQNATMLFSPMLGAVLAGRIGVGGVFLLAGIVYWLFALFCMWYVRRVLLGTEKSLQQSKPAS